MFVSVLLCYSQFLHIFWKMFIAVFLYVFVLEGKILCYAPMTHSFHGTFNGIVYKNGMPPPKNVTRPFKSGADFKGRTPQKREDLLHT